MEGSNGYIRTSTSYSTKEPTIRHIRYGIMYKKNDEINRAIIYANAGCDMKNGNPGKYISMNTIC